MNIVIQPKVLVPYMHARHWIGTAKDFIAYNSTDLKDMFVVVQIALILCSELISLKYNIFYWSDGDIDLYNLSLEFQEQLLPYIDQRCACPIQPLY